MVFSNTVQTLRHDASRRVRDLWTGSLTSTANAAATTLVDTKRVEVDGFFNNAYLHIGADAAAEDVRVSTNDQSSTNLTITPALAAQKTSGTAYEIHRLWSVPEYNGFIADAIRSIGSEGVLAAYDNSSLTITANANKPAGIEDEYAIPAGFRYIQQVWIADQLGYYYYEVPHREVSVLPGSTKKLRFSPWLCSTVLSSQLGNAIRLLGQGVASPPTLADTSIIEVDPDFVVSYVELQVLIPLAGGQGARAEAAQRRVYQLTPLVEAKRASAVTEHRVLPDSMRVPT